MTREIIEDKEKETGEIQLVVFRLGAEDYGVPITQVQEIIKMVTPTKIPNVPDFIEGIINLRGKVIPVIDLRKRFGLGSSEYNEATRIVVVEVAGHTVGIIVDFVSEVLRIPVSSIEAPPPIIAGIAAEYLRGVGKLDDRLLILLDLNKILTDYEKEQIGDVVEKTAV